MSSTYRLSLENWLKDLDVKADKVLDIGGAQLPVKGRTKSWDVKEYLIADLPEPHVGSPKPDMELDLNESPIFSDEAMIGGEPVTYMRITENIIETNFSDLIFCLEVFDYVWNPVQAMVNIKYLLKSGGKAWVTFQTIYPHHQPVEDDALRYMPGGIKKLASATGLTITDMIPRLSDTYAFMDFCRLERLRAAKHYDHRIMGYIVGLTK